MPVCIILRHRFWASVGLLAQVKEQRRCGPCILSTTVTLTGEWLSARTSWREKLVPVVYGYPSGVSSMIVYVSLEL